MIKNFSRNYGFTLIEMLVVITILLIVMGGAIAGFMLFRDRQDARETAKKVQLLFVTAQQKASVRESPPGCTPPPLQGYQVSYNSTSKTFSLVALCAVSPDDDPTTIPSTFTEVLIQDKDIAVPSSVSVTSGLAKFNFYTLERGTNTGSTRQYTFTIGSTSYRFSVTPSGSVSNVE